MSGYDELTAFVRESGLNDEESRHAVRRCIITMTKAGVGAYVGAGAIAYFMNMNPFSAAGFATATLGGGAALALVSSPSCGDVRKAVMFWKSAEGLTAEDP